EPRYLQIPRGRRKARTRSAILQAPLATVGSELITGDWRNPCGRPISPLAGPLRGTIAWRRTAKRGAGDPLPLVGRGLGWGSPRLRGHKESTGGLAGQHPHPVSLPTRGRGSPAPRPRY